MWTRCKIVHITNLFSEGVGTWEGLQQCRGFEDVHSDARLSVKCMCLSESKKPRDFTRLIQEDGSTYNILVICLHFIFGRPYFLVEICVILWLAKYVRNKIRDQELLRFPRESGDQPLYTARYAS